MFRTRTLALLVAVSALAARAQELDAGTSRTTASAEVDRSVSEGVGNSLYGEDGGIIGSGVVTHSKSIAPPSPQTPAGFRVAPLQRPVATPSIIGAALLTGV